MTEEEYLKDYEDEQYSKIIELEEDKYYKTPWFIRQSILSVMTDSEIALIIGEKKGELLSLEDEKKTELRKFKWVNREILELLRNDRLEEINAFIKSLMYILNSRNVNTWQKFNTEDLEKAKNLISITDVIEATTGEKIKCSFRLIKCPFPDHNDSTPSMKIYKNTNSFFCQWCRRWGTQVDFIMHMNKCSLPEAIKKFINFYKR